MCSFVPVFATANYEGATIVEGQVFETHTPKIEIYLGHISVDVELDLELTSVDVSFAERDRVMSLKCTYDTKICSFRSTNKGLYLRLEPKKYFENGRYKMRLRPIQGKEWYTVDGSFIVSATTEAAKVTLISPESKIYQEMTLLNRVDGYKSPGADTVYLAIQDQTSKYWLGSTLDFSKTTLYEHILRTKGTTWTFPLPSLTEGTSYRIVWRSEDISGNMTKSEERTFRYDPAFVTPTLHILQPTAQQTLVMGEDVEISWMIDGYASSFDLFAIEEGEMRFLAEGIIPSMKSFPWTVPQIGSDRIVLGVIARGTTGLELGRAEHSFFYSSSSFNYSSEGEAEQVVDAKSVLNGNDLKADLLATNHMLHYWFMLTLFPALLLTILLVHPFVHRQSVMVFSLSKDELTRIQEGRVEDELYFSTTLSLEKKYFLSEYIAFYVNRTKSTNHGSIPEYLSRRADFARGTIALLGRITAISVSKNGEHAKFVTPDQLPMQVSEGATLTFHFMPFSIDPVDHCEFAGVSILSSVHIFDASEII